MTQRIAYVYHAESDEDRGRKSPFPGVVFLSDACGGDYLIHNICGIEFTGVIFEETAAWNKRSFSYFMTRLRGNRCLLNEHHRALAQDIAEEYISSGANPFFVMDTLKRMGISYEH